MKLACMAAAALLLMACAKPPAPERPNVAFQLSVTIAMDTPQGPRLVPEHNPFQNGGRFRVHCSLDPGMQLYAFRLHGPAYSKEKGPILPSPDAWYQFDAVKGHEQFVFVVSPEPLPKLAAAPDSLASLKLDALIQEIERERRPLGIRRFIELPWVRTNVFGPAGATALALRMPLFHE